MNAKQKTKTQAGFRPTPGLENTLGLRNTGIRHGLAIISGHAAALRLFQEKVAAGRHGAETNEIPVVLDATGQFLARLRNGVSGQPHGSSGALRLAPTATALSRRRGYRCHGQNQLWFTELTF